MDPRTDHKLWKNKAFEDTNKLDLRNEIQETFGQHPTPWFSWVFDALDLSPQSHLLELGCGSGMFWLENAERVPHGWNITLSDLMTGMVKDARNHMIAVGPHFQYLVLNSQSLPFPNERYDAVLAIGLLDLVPNLDQMLSEAWRVLRPSGQLIASAGGKGHLQELEALLRPFLPAKQVRQLGGDESHFGLENGERLLSPYFEEVVRRDYNDQMVFTELQPILDYVLSEQAVVWSMPLDRLGKFVQQIKKKLAEQGEIGVTIRKGVFIARKKVIE